MAALSGSRRQLDFGLFDEVPFPGALETRTAARKWAESKGIFVGCFSQPQLSPDDKEVTTARCGECSDCWQGQGTVYRFVVEVVEQITKVRVYKAAQCSGPARTARAAPKHKEDELTVAEKRLISQMADQLQERGQNATSSAVMVRLEAKHPEAKVAANRVRRLLRHRRKVLGLTTSKFKESAADLTKTIDQLDARLCKVVQVSTAPPVGWICIMPRFLEELKAGLQAEGSTAWYLCADFTHTLEIMGFQYGLCSAMVLRMAKGEHVRTFWPLMLQCGSEDGDNYSAGFEKLHAELIEWGIPSPSQVHLDWFSSSKKAAQRVWPRAVVCRSIQHLRRNLLRNHRKGRRPPHPRKKKTKDQADSRRNRRNCSQPRLGEKKPKLAPHLKERSIFAFFDLFNRLMLVPSLSMHHLLLEIVLRRISNVWDDTSWVQYFEEQYCSKKRVDPELYGVDQVYKCDWWSGSASSGASWLPTPPSSQQVAEAANSKLKRDIRSQGPLSSHSLVLQTLSFCVGCWLKPARASDDGKPVGLLGETSVSRPPGPDDWMLQKDGRYLRPPFAKDMMWVPSVCRILQLMRKWKESHDEYQHGNFKYLVMAVGQPTKVPPGLAVRMRDMLKCQKITVLQEKLMSEGIVADEDGELVFDIDAWDKIWGKYALIWHNGDPAHPVRCSCWMWSFRNHCVHAYSAEEFWNIRVHTSPIIEGPPPSAKRRAASQEPSRRRR